MPSMPSTTLYRTGIAIGEAPYPDNIIGHWRSLKMRALLPYRTELARDYMIVCDYERSVTEYRALPFSMDYYHDNQPHEFLPDLIVVRDGVPTLVYCQDYEKWQTAEEKIGLGLATVWCMERGCELEVVTHAQLSAGPYLRNITLLRTFAQQDAPHDEILAVNAYLTSVGQPQSITTLAREIRGIPLSYGTSLVLHMAYHQMLSLPVHEEEIGPDTLVGLAADAHLADETGEVSA
jgi:hypothetical protein